MSQNNFNYTNKKSLLNNTNADYLKLKECMKNMNSETKFKFWIKTLISEQSTIPEIIKTVDKIIEIQASSVSFSTEIFNRNGSTINQVEKVIDLTERKNSLINLYVMTKKMLKSLSADNHDFLERRFIYNWSAEELAEYYSISIRTVYRKIDSLIKTVYSECLKFKWTLNFIESQTKNEEWLKEKFLKCISDYYKSINYKIDDSQEKSKANHLQNHNKETLGNFLH